MRKGEKLRLIFDIDQIHLGYGLEVSLKNKMAFFLSQLMC